MQTAKSFLKLTFAALLLFLGGIGAARAQTFDLDVAFAMPGSTTPISEINVASVTPESDGDRAFTVDIIVQPSATPFGNIGLRVQHNAAEIEAVTLADILTAPTAPFATIFRSNQAGSVGGVSYDQSYDWGWANGAVTGIAGVPANEYTKVAQVTFHYQLAGGNASIAFNQTPSGSAATFNQQTLTVVGPEVPQNANLTLEGTTTTAPNRNVQTTDQVGIEVTCNLTDNDGADYAAPAGGTDCSVVGVASVLGGAAGSATQASSPSDDDEYSGDDVTTAKVISIAATESSGTATFFVTPNSANATLQFDFRISAVEDYSTTSGSEDLATNQFEKASATFRIVNAAIQLTAANADGSCPATAGSVVATSPITEGGDAVVVCATLVSDPDSDVAVACEADAAGQAASLGVSGGGTLNDANRAMGLPITMSIPDNNIDGGGGSAVVTCTGTGTTGTAYESVSSTISLTITDPDMVASTGRMTATSTVSEKGGIQMVAVNAVIDAGPTPGTSCDVTVSLGTTIANIGDGKAGGTLAMAGGDVVASVAAGGDRPDADDVGGLLVAPVIPSAITIPAQSLSGTPIMVTVVPDPEDGTAAVPTDPADASTTAAASMTNNIGKEVILWDGADTMCGRTMVSFVSAVTLIVDKGTTEALQNVNFAVAPVVTQFAVASAMNSIQARATASRSGADREAVFSLAGNTTTESVLMTHMKGAAAMDDANDYEYDWKKAFSNSSFSMPIFGAGGGTLWASGDYRTMNGDNGITDWEGNSFLWSFGADARLNNDMLVGLMINISDTDIDYEENSLGTTAKGEYSLTGTSLRPYFAWETGRTELWGSLGFGTGEAEITTVDDTQTQDTSESSLSLGVKHGLMEGLSVQADLSQITTDFDEKKEGDTVVAAQQEVTSQRARLLLVGENSYNSGNGTITPKVEIGFRFDTADTDKASAVGDDEFKTREDSSTGTEAAMGVDIDSGGRLMGIKARFYSGNDYDEWGVSGIYEHRIGAAGLGLAMAMRPQYGNTASTAKSLFQQEYESAKKTTTPVAAAVNAPSMDSSLSYGFAAPGERGIITPYAQAVLGSDVATRSRLGMRWKPHSRFNVDVYGDNKAASDDYAMLLNWANKGPLDFALEGKRTEKAAGDISHSIVLKGTLDF